MKKLSLYVFLVLMLCSVGNALPKCEGDDFYNWTNCEGIYTSDDGKEKYVGEWKDGLFHGKATYIFDDYTYVGEFKDNKFHGQGTLTEKNRIIYVGEWKDGNEHGQGTLTEKNGDKYVGEFKDGKRHGQGTLTEVDGTIQKGIWKNGRLF